jgi:hypothetical protein
VGIAFPVRRFPPPWSVDDPDPRLDRQCFIVRDAKRPPARLRILRGRARPRAAAHLLTRDEARRIAANIAKLPELLRASDPTLIFA